MLHAERLLSFSRRWQIDHPHRPWRWWIFQRLLRLSKTIECIHAQRVEIGQGGSHNLGLRPPLLGRPVCLRENRVRSPYFSVQVVIGKGSDPLPDSRRASCVCRRLCRCNYGSSLSTRRLTGNWVTSAPHTLAGRPRIRLRFPHRWVGAGSIRVRIVSKRASCVCRRPVGYDWRNGRDAAAWRLTPTA